MRAFAANDHPRALGPAAEVEVCGELGDVAVLARLAVGVLGQAIECAWQAGGGPGDERLIVDVDSFVGEVHGQAKQGAAFGYTRERRRRARRRGRGGRDTRCDASPAPQ